MRVELHAEHTGHGVLLSRIDLEADAQSLCNFFREQGLTATIGPSSVPGDQRIFLPHLTIERFVRFVDKADIEMIP